MKLLPLHIVFDGPPGPEAGRFVECERPDGSSLNAGEWHDRGDGYWELRIPDRIVDAAAQLDLYEAALRDLAEGLFVIADGEGEAQVIARQTLEAAGLPTPDQAPSRRAGQ